MTGQFFGAARMSMITVANLEDMGYVVTDNPDVDFDASDVNPSCRCSSSSEESAPVDEVEGGWNENGEYSARPPLSTRGRVSAMAYGKRRMRQLRQRNSRAGGMNTTGVKFVGDQSMTVLYQENGFVYGVWVQGDD